MGRAMRRESRLEPHVDTRCVEKVWQDGLAGRVRREGPWRDYSVSEEQLKRSGLAMGVLPDP